MEVKDIVLRLMLVNSYPYYHKSKWYQDIYDIVLEDLGECKPNEKKALRWFISNSARSLRRGAIGYTFSLRMKHYSGNSLGISYRGVKSVLDKLIENKWVDFHLGGVVTWKHVGEKVVPDEMEMSFLVFTDKFLDLWEGADFSVNLWLSVEANTLVEVRDRGTKESKSLRGINGIKEIREWIMKFNEHTRQSVITFDGECIADITWKKVYSDNLGMGGRIYAEGGGVQQIPALMRKSLLKIDGESVVEIDYKAIHPNICYQLVLQNSDINVKDFLGEDFDAYGVDLSHLNITINEEKKAKWEEVNKEEHKPIRTLIKLAILIAVNCDGYHQAMRALNQKVFNDRTKPEMEQELYAIEGSIPSSQVLLAVQDHNDFIAESFFSDFGIIAQNYDSRIMTGVVDRMMQLGHTVLVYHDSAIVKESAEKDLKAAMVESWKDVFGNTEFCYVEKK